MKKVLIYAGLASLLMAGEDGFDLAPTPVSQTQVKPGESEGMTRLTYITSSGTASDEDFSVSGVGIQVAKKKGDEDGATNLSGAFLNLSGSSGNIDGKMTIGNVAYLWEKYDTTKEGAPYTVFYGFDFSYAYLGMSAQEEGYSSSLWDLDVYSELYGGTLGVEYNIHTPEMIISPFAVGKYLMGSYESHFWIYDEHYYETGDINPMLTTAFGFDIYLKAVGGTLSAMVKNDAVANTTVLSYALYW